MVVNSLKDENSKTKSNLQHELLSQRQQLELHIAHLNEQHQQVIESSSFVSYVTTSNTDNFFPFGIGNIGTGNAVESAC